MSRFTFLGIGVGIFFIFLIGNVFLSRTHQTDLSMPAPTDSSTSTLAIARSATTTNEEWKQILSLETYYIMREAGTERPYTSPLEAEERPGTYVSADCGEPLFRSEQKYHSGTGWPSFWAPINPEALKLEEDRSIPFQPRTEVITSKCGGHLGHVFDDGPEPTGKRYCINGAALRFIPDEEAATSTTPSPSGRGRT